MMNYSILIVETDPEIADQLVAVVKAGEWRAHTAVDDTTAIAALTANRVHILILDWNLPDGQAMKIVEAVRGNHRWRRIHIIAISPISDPATVEAVLKSGADDFFAQPIQANELRSRLSWAIGRLQQIV